MNLLAALLSQASTFSGHGTNQDGDHFNAQLEMQPLVNATALMLHFTATRTDCKLLHQEATLLAAGPDGALCLRRGHGGAAICDPHRAIDSSLDEEDGTLAVVFASGPRDAAHSFRQEITLALKPGGELCIAHSWGMPNGVFAERSSCTLRAVVA